MKFVEDAIELVESILKVSTPDPFCTVKAVVEEMFMRSPPAAVNPERKEPEEFCSSRRLAVAEAAARMPTPVRVAAPWVIPAWPRAVEPIVKVSVVVA